MDFLSFFPGVLVFALLYGGLIALAVWIGYLVIKAAVRNALKEHTLWRETRELSE